MSAGFTSSRERDRDCAPENPAYVFNPNEAAVTATISSCRKGCKFRGPTTYDSRRAYRSSTGINVGIVYLDNDEGSDDATYSIIPGSTTGVSTVYPNGALTPTRTVSGKPAPPCPTTNGCVPGAFVLPSGFILPTGTTLLTLPLVPTGHVRSERLHQLDLRISKTFTVRKIRIQPTLDIANVLNSDHIIDFQSQSYASSASNYLEPDDVLLGRVIGVGATVKW